MEATFAEVVGRISEDQKEYSGRYRRRHGVLEFRNSERVLNEIWGNKKG